MLVIAPTRELAEQIYRQTLILTQPWGLHTEVLYGGVPKRFDLRRLYRQTPSILIATPGRLLDHLESTVMQDGSLFADCFKETSILVLDEVDRLLEMGFYKGIMEIASYLPGSDNRQTLLFSATMPRTVKGLMDACVRSAPEQVVHIDCIHQDDPAKQTNASTEQTYVMLPQDRLVSGLVELILRIQRQPTNKIVVFFPTTAQVEYFSHLFTTLGHRFFQIHSKMNQSMRMVTSQQFRLVGNFSPHQRLSSVPNRSGAVLLTTDLTARGMDYPDVTHVIQVGAASSRAMYLHRLGRTGRAGRSGQGILVLLDLEMEVLQQDLAGLDVRPNHYFQRLLDVGTSKTLRNDLLRIQHEIRTGQANVLKECAVEVYRSILGYYSTRLRALGIRSPENLIELVNAFASQAGLVELPPVSEKLARQTGLFGNSRIRVNARWTPGRTFQVNDKSNIL